MKRFIRSPMLSNAAATLFLLILLAMSCASAFAQDRIETAEKTIFPTAFLQKEHLAKIEFLGDDKSAILTYLSYLGSPDPRVELLDCESGRITNILHEKIIVDCVLTGPANFLLATASGGTIKINRYDFDGNLTQRIGELAETRNSPTRLFWWPAAERTVVIHGDVVYQFKPDSAMTSFRLESAPERGASSVRGEQLFVGLQNVLQVVDLKAGKTVGSIDVSNPVYAVTLSDDCSRVLLGTCRKTNRKQSQIVVVNYNNGKLKFDKGFEFDDYIVRIDLLSSGNAMVSGYTNSIGFNLETGENIWNRKQSTTYLSQSKLFAAVADAIRIRILDAATGKQVSPTVGHTSAIIDLAFVPDTNSLRSSQFDGQVFEWSMGSGTLTSNSEFDSGNYLGGQLSRNEFVLVDAAQDVITLNKVDRAGKLLEEFKTNLNGRPSSARPLSDGNVMVLTHDSSNLLVFDSDSVEPQSGISIHDHVHDRDEEYKIQRYQISQDNRFVLVWVSTISGDDVSADFTFVYDRKNEKTVLRTPQHCFSPGLDSKHDLFVQPEFDNLVFRRLSTGKKLFEVPNTKASLFSRLEISPDGRFVACSASVGLKRKKHGTIIVDAADGETLAEFGGHDDFISSLKFNHDSSQLISAGQDGKINFWSLQDLGK